MAGIATIRGRSIDRALFDRDDVLFYRAVKKIVSGEAYVLRYGDELLCNYLSRQGDQINIGSENSAMLPPFVLPLWAFESGTAEVIGVACSSGHNWRKARVLVNGDQQ